MRPWLTSPPIGTGHSEAIITNDFDAAARWIHEVDAAAVVVNASTRFVDGSELGLGAEIGISTQKLHARGPMGLRELTCAKLGVTRKGTDSMSALDPREELAQRLGLADVPPPRFASPGDVTSRLREQEYLSDEAIASVTFLADRLAKPVLVEGPAGTGKTALAKAVADATGARLIRLQCYEGLDESKALYEWNYRKQLPAYPGRTARGQRGPKSGRPSKRTSSPKSSC
jgi:hypothetical protein